MIKYIISGIQYYHGLEVEHRLGHCLSDIWKRMEDLMMSVMNDRLFSDDQEKDQFDRVKRRVLEFQKLDPKSESFRYSRTNRGQKISDPIQVAPNHLRRLVAETSSYLFSLYDYCTDGQGPIPSL